MSTEFDKIMNFDAFGEAAKITGKSRRNDPETKILGTVLSRENLKLREESLIAHGDTHHSINFEDACKVYEKHGFKTIYEEQFTNNRGLASGVVDTFKIMWRDGILLTCESYWGGLDQNSSTMYYNWVLTNKERKITDFLDGGSFFDTELGEGLAGFHGARSGFAYKLSKMEENGTFLSTWAKNPIVFLYNYSEHEHGIESTKWKLPLLPTEVQEAIKVCFGQFD